MEDEFADIRLSVSKICAEFDHDYWRKLDQEKAYPEAFVNALTQSGYLAALIPEAYGGAGLPLRAAAAILEEIHKSGGNAAACHAQMYIMGTILRHGSEAQKQQYLPQIASSALRLQAFGVTEPTSGTDTLALRTTATKTKGGYIVNGQKIWTSRAEYSDLMLLLARTTAAQDVTQKGKGLSVFLLDMRELVGNGLTIKPIDTMINHATTEVFFDDVFISDDALIGKEGDGFSYILSGMNAERILIAAECIGDAKWFLETAASYANDRSLFGHAIGANQGVAFPLAKAYAHMRAAEAIVDKAAQLYDEGQSHALEANMAKMLAADASWEAGEACLQTHGGFGFASEYNIERKFRETRLYQVAPISTNLILAFIAEKALGLPKSYGPGKEKK